MTNLVLILLCCRLCAVANLHVHTCSFQDSSPNFFAAATKCATNSGSEVTLNIRARRPWLHTPVQHVTVARQTFIFCSIRDKRVCALALSTCRYEPGDFLKHRAAPGAGGVLGGTSNRGSRELSVRSAAAAAAAAESRRKAHRHREERERVRRTKQQEFQ